jgi:hypothetical protein
MESVPTILVASFYWRKEAEEQIKDLLRERRRRRKLQQIPREVLLCLGQKKIEKLEKKQSEVIQTQSFLALAA